MAKIHFDYYSGEDQYSDGEIEEEIQNIVQDGKTLEELDDVSFPVLYHLSKVRENILNWYPFEEGSSALEIGSGMGAITGLLSRRFSKLVSVELSRRRAEINYARHEQCENLEIYVGNLNDMDFGMQFDYIILNGVFEYAMSFTEGDTPYETFLQNIRRFLRPGGKILISIENRLGLKYFAGAPEDHTDAYFDGLKEYEGNSSVRTFSRAEWVDLMQKCGLNYFRFYYPYPDYKFPEEVFTDESLEDQPYGRVSWNFTEYRMQLFPERDMAASLQHEGVIAQFANSFLIEMSDSPIGTDRRVLYAKLSTDRADAFSIATVTEERDGRKVVIKKPMTEEAEAHIDQMSARQGSYGGWQPLEGKREQEGLVYPYLTQKNFGQIAIEAIRDGQTDRVRELLRKVYELCTAKEVRHVLWSFRSEEEVERFREVFGDAQPEEETDCIAPGNIDLILDNIFEAEEGQPCPVIDCEWIFDFPIPSLFLFWRAVNELYSRTPALEKQLPLKSLLEEYGITDRMAGVFWDWATHFTEQYVLANTLRKRSISEIPASLEEIRAEHAFWDRLSCQLYYDAGNGFSERQKITAPLNIQEGEFSVDFDLKGIFPIMDLRFDPIEGEACLCRIDAKNSSARLIPMNAAVKTKQGDLFFTTDPNYGVKDWQDEKVHICGEIKILSEKEALELADARIRERRGPAGRLFGGS